jgi:hypothetical protein
VRKLNLIIHLFFSLSRPHLFLLHPHQFSFHYLITCKPRQTGSVTLPSLTQQQQQTTLTFFCPIYINKQQPFLTSHVAIIQSFQFLSIAPTHMLSIRACKSDFLTPFSLHMTSKQTRVQHHLTLPNPPPNCVACKGIKDKTILSQLSSKPL